MFYNLKIAYRSLKQNKFYSIINIAGLSIGMAIAILLLVWIYNEWSYDRFHTKEKQLYNVWSRSVLNGDLNCWEQTAMVMGPTLKSDYPEIAEMTRMQVFQTLFTEGDKKLNIQVGFVDPGFLTMFSFLLLKGDKESALNDTYSVILTEKTAERIFGKEDPMGKTVILDAQHPATVTGIMKNLPSNTTFDFEALVPFAYQKVAGKYYNENWGNSSLYTYVELQPQADQDKVNQAICNIIKEHTNNDVLTETFIYPFSKYHLYSKFENGVPVGGRIETLRIFGLATVLILLIACINFTNLSTARSEKRGREVGVRKVMGAKRGSLIGQFLGESTIIALIAGVIAIFLVELTLPAYSILMGKTLGLDLTNGRFWMGGVLFILFTALLAGSYPAFYLSSFLPVKVLKGIFKGNQTLIAPRKILVIMQFIFAIFFITSALVINRQIRYAQNRDNGYNREQLVYHPFTGDIESNYELIKRDLLNSGIAISVTKMHAPMTNCWFRTWGIHWKGKSDDLQMVDICFVDADWTKTTGTKIIRGRDIDPYTYPTDSTAALLNESAVKLMNFDDPIGEIVSTQGIDFHIVGVVKDFILRSPYDPINPTLIGGLKGWFNVMHIRLNGGNTTSDNLAKTEQIFRKYNPNYPFEYKFVDEEYAQKFQEEKTTRLLVTWFGILAIFISCMGLFALVAYMAEARTKEIGIRKVLGASIQDIMYLLSKEFMALIFIALAITVPVAWWAMNKWLTSYSYHTNMPWWLFGMVASLALSIALLTISFQSIKAATANPVKSIKTEL